LVYYSFYFDSFNDYCYYLQENFIWGKMGWRSKTTFRTFLLFVKRSDPEKLRINVV